MADFLVQIDSSTTHTLLGVSISVSDTGVLMAYGEVELVAAYAKWESVNKISKTVR